MPAMQRKNNVGLLSCDKHTKVPRRVLFFQAGAMCGM
jgi:hypothetical protein